MCLTPQMFYLTNSESVLGEDSKLGGLSDFTLFVQFLARFDFSSDLFGTRNVTSGHPWVPNDVNKTEAILRLVLEHLGDQTFELLRVKALRLVLGVSLPEEVGSAHH